MWPFKKKRDPDIFFTTDEWAIRKFSPIEPAQNFLPKSFKVMDTFAVRKKYMIDSVKTIKSCPGIVDYCSAGYVITAWCDMEINASDDGQNTFVRYSHPKFQQGGHRPEVIQNFMSHKFGVRMSVKLDNPWAIWTKPGISAMYLPMYYYEDTRNWEALPGIIDHDIGAVVSPINIMLKEIKPTFIKQGEPLVQVVPFRREEFIAYTGDNNDTTKARYNALSYLHNMSFSGWIKHMRSKKSYSIDAHDTDLPC